MRIFLIVIAMFVGLGSGPRSSLAGENPSPGVVQPRTGEGWTREEARNEEHLPSLTVISATVVQLSVRGGRFIVMLDNGTVWSQTRSKDDVRVAVGDNITLRKASLGSHVLVTIDGVWTRVKRER